jgi:hypothetical protein
MKAVALTAMVAALSGEQVNVLVMSIIRKELSGERPNPVLACAS